MYLAPRTASEKESLPRSLDEYRNRGAYVLLGEPGMGKTESFKMETEACNGKYIKARYFVTEGAGADWKGEILFIDGLDEMRAGNDNSHTPLDQIRLKLIELKKPKFRLSCREADWLGSSDIEALARVAPDGEVSSLHLEALNNDQIKNILSRNFNIDDPREFINKAWDRGLFELLQSPQNLGMLAEAVQGSDWPDTKEQTYELACGKLLYEANKGHRDLQRSPREADAKLLDSAGYLNAALLLAGTEGWALDADATDEFYPLLESLENKDNLPISVVNKTRLFRTEQEHCIPTHRSIAEYLGARYLAKLVDRKHTPLGRVIALIIGPDGGVAPQLRGLHAWLAVHCLAARHAIRRDPLGVILYGDIHKFTTSDKHLIIKTLASEADEYAGFRSDDWNSRPFAALATPDMKSTFQAILRSPDRSESHQALLGCVIDALWRGQSLNLNNELEAIVRDCKYWPGLKRTALITLCGDLENNSNRLLKMLDDIETGTLDDNDDAFLGILLNALYPEFINGVRIIDYIHLPKQENLYGQYQQFNKSLSEKTPDKFLSDLLNTLSNVDSEFFHNSYTDDVIQSVGELLVRGLNLHGNKISIETLYSWLGIGLIEKTYSILEEDTKNKLQAWFETKPEQYKSIIEFGVETCTSNSTDEFHLCIEDLYARLCRSSPPVDLGLWHLESALNATTETISKYHFKSAIECLIREQGNLGLTLDDLVKPAQSNQFFSDLLSNFLTCPLGNSYFDSLQKEYTRQKERKEEQQARISLYQTQIESIRNGTAAPNILHQLASCYFGRYSDIHGETPELRFKDFFGGERSLINASLEGLLNTLKRADLPGIEKIVKLRLSGELDYLCAPALAGVAELTKDNPNRIEDLSDETTKTLIAFFFAEGSSEQPKWFDYLAQEKPNLISAVLSAFAPKYLRSGKDSIPLLYALAFDEKFSEVARLSGPSLLKGFPSRARKNQLEQLKHLLTAGHRFVDKKDLCPIIKNKLSLKSLDTGQRVYWMAVGLLMLPQQYESKILGYIGKNQTRAHHLITFLTDWSDQWDLNKELTTASMESLILSLGADSSPERIKDSIYASPIGEFVHGLIHKLSNKTDQEAEDSLKKLFTSSSLNHWQWPLKRARHNQKISLRTATFHHASVREVEITLMNLQPASHADLNALILDHLKDIENKLHNGNTDRYEDYWNLGKHGKCDVPKLENNCRNTLLSTLQERLIPLQIDAQPEGYYAESKRADIRVSFGGAGGINIPIEIKRDSHKDLWSAIYNQLIPLYTKDPGANGYGIYLVFWFGGKDIPKPPDGERKPRSAIELENRLRTTLKREDSTRIEVYVLDCSCDNADSYNKCNS